MDSTGRSVGLAGTVRSPAAVARALLMPLDDARGAPDRRAADQPVGFGHLLPVPVRGDRGRGDAEVCGDIGVDLVRALDAEIPGRYRAAVTLGAGAGLRQGEAFGLTVDRVDFRRRTVQVDRQLVTPKSGPPMLGPPKRPASVRTIP